MIKLVKFLFMLNKPPFYHKKEAVSKVGFYPQPPQGALRSREGKSLLAFA
jgi:hypothetical protein